MPFALVTDYAGLVLDDPELAHAPRLGKPVNQAQIGGMLRRLLDRS